MGTFTRLMGANSGFQRIWTKYIPLIVLKLKQTGKNNEMQQINLDKFDFVNSNVPKSGYSFTLEYNNGITSSHMKMSAIAREFSAAISANPSIVEMVKSGRYTFKLSSNYTLSIQKHGSETTTDVSL